MNNTNFIKFAEAIQAYLFCILFRKVNTMKGVTNANYL